MISIILAPILIHDPLWLYAVGWGLVTTAYGLGLWHGAAPTARKRKRRQVRAPNGRFRSLGANKTLEEGNE